MLPTASTGLALWIDHIKSSNRAKGTETVQAHVLPMRSSKNTSTVSTRPAGQQQR
jgi:hypothetical protein